MALPTVPATVKLSWFYTMNGEPAMNRIHVSVASTLPTAGDCTTLAQAGSAWWQANVKALVPSTFILREVNAVSIAEVNGPQGTATAGLPMPGTNAGVSLPNNVSFAVSLRTGLTGRSARGRWFWGGLTEDQVTLNSVTAPTVALIVGAIDTLISTIQGLSAQVVIVSYFANKVLRPGGPVKFIVTDALAVDDIVDSQRGRLH